MNIKDMQMDEDLASIKFIRNIFDTIGVECGIASRLSMDTWGNVLESGENLRCIGYANTVIQKAKSLEGLLNSIKVHAERIINGSVVNPPDALLYNRYE